MAGRVATTLTRHLKRLLPTTKSSRRMILPIPSPFHDVRSEPMRFTSIHSCANSTGNSSPYFLVSRFRPDDNGGVHDYYVLSTEDDHQNFKLKKDEIIEPPKVSRTPHVVAGSCNGLVCLDDSESNVLLWNPSINDSISLPQSSVPRPSIDDEGIKKLGAVAISTKADCTGFGFDCKSNDYKVVRFIGNDFEDEEGHYVDSHDQVELYSLKSNSWKELEMPNALAYDACSAYVNGAYYWLAFGERETGMLILSFDFVDEKFSFLPFPPKISRLHHVRLLELDGLLSLVSYSMLGIDKSFHVWVWNGSSWAKEFVFHTHGVESLLGFWRNGSQLFFLNLDNELLLVDRATATVKNLGISERPGMIVVIPCIESSVPLNRESDIA